MRSATAPQGLEGLRVLVAVDDAGERRALLRLLDGWGARAVPADVDDAAALARATLPDIALVGESASAAFVSSLHAAQPAVAVAHVRPSSTPFALQAVLEWAISNPVRGSNPK